MPLSGKSICVDAWKVVTSTKVCRTYYLYSSDCQFGRRLESNANESVHIDCTKLMHDLVPFLLDVATNTDFGKLIEQSLKSSSIRQGQMSCPLWFSI